MQLQLPTAVAQQRIFTPKVVGWSPTGAVDQQHCLDSARVAKKQLFEYEQALEFDKTPEPRGGEAAGDGGRFVVQEHHARNLHWDLRLSAMGSRCRGRCPKACRRTRNRLAVHTEDHPLEYLTFEGEIPKGEYGAGTMSVWDRGTYEALEEVARQEGDGRPSR